MAAPLGLLLLHFVTFVQGFKVKVIMKISFKLKCFLVLLNPVYGEEEKGLLKVLPECLVHSCRVPCYSKCSVISATATQPWDGFNCCFQLFFHDFSAFQEDLF